MYNCSDCVPQKSFSTLFHRPSLTGRATIGRLELPPGEGRFVHGPPLREATPRITAYTAGSFCVWTLYPPPPTPRTPLFRRGSREVEPLSRGGFADAFHGPPPDGGASRRWEGFRLRVTARPRIGGRRAVGPYKGDGVMVVLVVADPLWGTGGSCVCSCKKGVRVCFDWACYFRGIVLGETSLGRRKFSAFSTHFHASDAAAFGIQASGPNSGVRVCHRLSAKRVRDFPHETIVRHLYGLLTFSEFTAPSACETTDAR